MWNTKVNYQTCHGFNLPGVNGLMWRAPDTADNRKVFEPRSANHLETSQLKIRMSCQIEPISHIRLSRAFDGTCVRNSQYGEDH
jgi:hypothetical protein